MAFWRAVVSQLNDRMLRKLIISTNEEYECAPILEVPVPGEASWVTGKIIVRQSGKQLLCSRSPCGVDERPLVDTGVPASRKVGHVPGDLEEQLSKNQ
jgi:hypothetical protein